MSTLQFGVKEPGRDYPDRPAAFAIVARDGLIALAQVARRRERTNVLDLPGGGLDPGETARAAAVREVLEETGLRVVLAPEPFVRADHYFLQNDGGAVNTRGRFFLGAVEAEAPELRTEPDHRLVWLDAHQAVARLDRESHAWAVVAWLRRLQGHV
jgi:8-oxo-dGTP diphosphatase